MEDEQTSGVKSGKRRRQLEEMQHRGKEGDGEKLIR